MVATIVSGGGDHQRTISPPWLHCFTERPSAPRDGPNDPYRHTGGVSEALRPHILSDHLQHHRRTM